MRCGSTIQRTWHVQVVVLAGRQADVLILSAPCPDGATSSLPTVTSHCGEGTLLPCTPRPVDLRGRSGDLFRFLVHALVASCTCPGQGLRCIPLFAAAGPVDKLFLFSSVAETCFSSEMLSGFPYTEERRGGSEGGMSKWPRRLWEQQFEPRTWPVPTLLGAERALSGHLRGCCPGHCG